MARPRKFDEADVVAAARDEFWSRGYAATSVDDLTSATGLGKGSLYGAFGDKHELFLRVLDGYCTSALDKVRAQLRDPGRSAYERLAHHIRAQAARVVADKGARGCMMSKSAAELGAIDEAVAQTVGRTLDAWRNELVSCIKAAQRDGSVDAKQNPQALATMLLAVLRGMEALGKGGIKPAQIKAAAEEALALIRTRGE
jgi:TetR/AcrR family transcriptional regulator, transcriptional repressor for nem operon